MPFSNVAQIVDWEPKSKFGFAIANGQRYFVHISALGSIARQPEVGDTIIVERFEKTDTGKKIAAGVLDGVPPREALENKIALWQALFVASVVFALITVAIQIAK